MIVEMSQMARFASERPEFSRDTRHPSFHPRFLSDPLEQLDDQLVARAEGSGGDEEHLQPEPRLQGRLLGVAEDPVTAELRRGARLHRRQDGGHRARAERRHDRGRGVRRICAHTGRAGRRPLEEVLQRILLLPRRVSVHPGNCRFHFQ